MKVCIPVEEDRGLESTVYGHFGSAPVFALVDTETLAVEPVSNRDERHQHRACSPLKAIGGLQVNAVIVGGIGAGAIRGLQAAGIGVFRFVGRTAADAVRQSNAGALPALTLQHACGGPAAGHDCHGHSIQTGSRLSQSLRELSGMPPCPATPIRHSLPAGEASRDEVVPVLPRV